MPPNRLGSGLPNRSITQIEIWTSFKSQIRPRPFGFRSSKPLDYPNWDLNKFQNPNFPNHLDLGLPNRWISQIEIWTNFKSQFSLTVWIQDFQTVGLPKLRFEQVSNHKFAPNRLDSGAPNHWITHIEIWTNFKTQISPTVWIQDFQTIGLPKLRFEQISKPKFPQPFGFRTFKPLDYPNWDLNKFQIPIFPDCSDSGVLNRWLPKLRFERVSNSHFPRPFGFRTSKPLYYPNWDFNNFQIPIFPNRSDSGVPNHWITQIKIWTSFKSQFPLTVWIQELQTVGLPKLRFEQVSNPNSPRPFGFRSSKLLDYWNWDLNKFQIPNSLWPFGFRSSKPLHYPNWDLDKFQNPTFPDRLDSRDPNYWITQIGFWTSFKSPIPPDHLDSGTPIRWITQIEIWTSFKSPTPPDRFESGAPNRWITQIEIWTSFKFLFSPTVWTQDFQTVGLPKLRFKQVSNPNFPRPFGFRSSESLDYPK